MESGLHCCKGVIDTFGPGYLLSKKDLRFLPKLQNGFFLRTSAKVDGQSESKIDSFSEELPE